MVIWLHLNFYLNQKHHVSQKSVQIKEKCVNVQFSSKTLQTRYGRQTFYQHSFNQANFNLGQHTIMRLGPQIQHQARRSYSILSKYFHLYQSLYTSHSKSVCTSARWRRWNQSHNVIESKQWPQLLVPEFILVKNLSIYRYNTCWSPTVTNRNPYNCYWP